MIKSLCKNIYQIQRKEFNTISLAGIGYDLFFFQDQNLDKVDDVFKLILTESAWDIIPKDLQD